MKEKKEQKQFTNDFKVLSSELSPVIEAFLVDHKITLKPTLYFFASLIYELLKQIEDNNEKEAIIKTLLLFISEDKYGEV